MPTHEEHIRRILSESGEPLFLSDITERLNAELVSGPAFDTTAAGQAPAIFIRSRDSIKGWALDAHAADDLILLEHSPTGSTIGKRPTYLEL